MLCEIECKGFGMIIPKSKMDSTLLSFFVLKSGMMIPKLRVEKQTDFQTELRNCKLRKGSQVEHQTGTKEKT